MKATFGNMELRFDDGMDLSMNMQEFDPLRTPYEVNENDFPLDGTFEEQFTFLLRYAVLAPSGHNTQPWLFSLNENGVHIYPDYSRRLPVVDPGNRELYMSIGAAVFNLRVAAARFGFECRVSYNYSDDSEAPLAFAHLTPSADAPQTDRDLAALFPSILKRHTNRNPFLYARIADSRLAEICSVGNEYLTSLFVSKDPAVNTNVAELVGLADKMQQADPSFRRELAEWLRPNNTRRPDGMTGAAFGIGDLASFFGPWAMKTLNLGTLRAEKDRLLCMEAPGLIVLHGEDSIPHYLDAGELLEHLLLRINAAGLQTSFFNMPIQVPELRLALRRALDLENMPQLMLRIGYCITEPPPSPRRPVEDVIIKDDPLRKV